MIFYRQSLRVSYIVFYRESLTFSYHQMSLGVDVTVAVVAAAVVVVVVAAAVISSPHPSPDSESRCLGTFFSLARK